MLTKMWMGMYALTSTSCLVHNSSDQPRQQVRLVATQLSELVLSIDIHQHLVYSPVDVCL